MVFSQWYFCPYFRLWFMSLFKHLNKYDIVLGSGSPRRKELLAALGVKFRIVTSDKEEIFPDEIDVEDVAVFLSEMKSRDIQSKLNGPYFLITADTIVIHEDQILGKPVHLKEAKETLRKLAGKDHIVVTGVTIATNEEMKSFSDTTIVSLASMNQVEIEHSVQSDQVLDKAGSYGIQDWIGHAKISNLKGSYYNVMGLPTERLYHYLLNWE